MRSRFTRALGVAAIVFTALAVTSPLISAQSQVPPSGTPASGGPSGFRPSGARPASRPAVSAPRPAATATARPVLKGTAAARPSSIQGSAWQSDNGPVPRALLRLRNVITGSLQDTTVANDAGNFVFNTVPEGTYVIEMVTQSGKVVMVGQTFTVAPGETVATFVRLGPKIPWFNGFFNNAASIVSSSAASTGVTAIAPEAIPPVSAVR